MEIDNLKGFSYIVNISLALVVLGLLIFPYIRIEIQTRVYGGRMEETVKNFCKETKNQSSFKYFKILKINDKSAETLCVFEDGSKNLLVNLDKDADKNWGIVFQKLYEEEKQIYWPYYY